MANNNNKDEIISFVLNSSDVDNLIVATFIAGMQAKKSVSIPTLCVNLKDEDRRPNKPPINRPA